MINFKKLFETVYQPKSGDEKNFKDKHIVHVTTEPVVAPGQFTSDKKKAKRRADYDVKEDEAVYEAATVHTKRADKEAVIVRAVDPNTGQSKARVVKRGTGEIKIGEEVELEESVDPKDYSTHGVKSQFGGYRAEIKHKTKGHTMYSGGHTYETASKAKGEADAYLKGYSAPGGMGNDRHAASLANKHASIHAVKGPYAKKSVKEETELDEKVGNAYAIGMAAAMKKAGDTPPLKKSTITKGHEIAKSIMKKEAMDPVGKADADIDNDGDVDKSDKYLHARRKAIGKALRKEEVELDEAVEVRHDRYMRSHGKKASGGSGQWMFTHKDRGDVNYKDDKEVHTANGKFADAKKSAQAWAKKHGHSSVYVMEGVEELEEAPGKRVSSAYRMTVPLKDGQVHPDHAEKINDLKAKVRADNAKEGTKNKVVLQGRLGKDNPNASKYKSKSTGKSFPGSHQRIKLGDASHADVYVREEVEELDEISQETLRSYHAKAGSDRLKAKAEVQKGMAQKKFTPASVQKTTDSYKRFIKRGKGMTAAANKMDEEVEQIDELSKKTLGSYVRKAADSMGNAAHSLGKKSERSDEVDRMTNRHMPDKYNVRDNMKKALDADEKSQRKDREVIGKRIVGIGQATQRLAKEEVELIDEAVKAGSMKLHDGSSVNVTRAMADTLNSVFEQLNPSNRVKMEQKLHNSKKDFEEILKFAENVNG